MRGEDVTLSAIQKSVQEELEGVKNKAGELINEARAKSFIHRLAGFVKEVVLALVKFAAKIVSVAFIIFSLIILFLITVLLLCAFGLFGFAMQNHIIMMMAPRVDMVFGLIGILLMVGIPAVLLFLAGLKWLFKINWNLKRVAAILAGVTLIGIGVCLITAYNISRYYAGEASVYNTTAWQVPANKVLHVKLNPKHAKFTYVQMGNGSFSVNGDDMDDDTSIRNSINLRIEQGNTDSVELVTDFTSRGLNRTEAAALARDIEYNFDYSDSSLTLDPFCTIGKNDVWRAQKVKLILRIPANTSVKLDKNLDNGSLGMDVQTTDDMNDDDYYGHTFTMTNDGLKCSDCNDTADNKQDKSTNKWHHGIHHLHNNGNHETDSLKMKIGHKSSNVLPTSFANYLDENVHSDDPISFPVAVVKGTVNQYSDSFIAYLKNTLHPDEVVTYVDGIYNTGETYAALFNDYLKSAVNPDEAINYTPGTQMADNMGVYFVNYLKTSVPADEAFNYQIGNTPAFANETMTSNATLVLH